MDNKMVPSVIAPKFSFQAQLEQNIEREEQARISLGFGKRDKAALLEGLTAWELPSAEKWGEVKQGTSQSWEAAWKKVHQGPSTPAWNNLQPPPLTQRDDIEAYLATFERVAEACQWPRDEWTSRLAPALCRNAQQAHWALSADDAQDYEELKEAVLKGYSIPTETRRQRFRDLRYLEEERPLDVCGQLQGLCYQWLKPDRHTKEQILELLVLEQFVSILPPEAQSWVQKRGPETCRQAVALVEDFLLGQQEVKTWGQQEVVKDSPQQEPTASGTGQRFVCQVEGLQSHANSSSPGDGWIPSEKEVQTLPQETCEGEDLRSSSPARHTTDFSQDPERVFASQTRAAKALSRRAKDASAILHNLGRHKNQGTVAGAGGRPHGESGGRQVEALRDKRTHPKDRPFQCPKCRRRFAESSALHQHLKSHFAEKRYQCTECEMRFRQSSDLIKHQRIHTGEKPYQCLECGKTFSLCSALYRHCRGHSGEKPFQCKECGKSFTRNSSLAQHHRLHKR